MTENLSTWIKYKKFVKNKISKGDTKTIKKILERNTINMGRVALTTYALLTLLVKKKLI